MDSALECAILGQLAVCYPAPVEALDMLESVIGIRGGTESFADSVKRLMDAGLLSLTTRPGWPSYLALTGQGLEYAQQLKDEAFYIMGDMGHVAQA